MNYTVRAASIATGVSEGRLRTWERRYGVPRPKRSPTGRRLYDEQDLALIGRMAALVEAGVPAAHAAEAVLSEDTTALVVPPRVEAPAHPLVAELLADAARFDGDAVAATIARAVEELGWPAALGSVLFPALKATGTAWELDEIPPAQEHLLSEQLRLALLAAVTREATSPGGALVVLACPEGERHDLGLSALWLLLRQAGFRVCYLGADVPTSDLARVVTALHAEAICLSATGTMSRSQLARTTRELAQQRLDTVVFAGGPAIAEDAGETIVGIRLPAAIDEAASTIAGRLRRD
ncbi:MAG: cobalamin-dependent protein [Dehalococcoidia bacterium]